MALEYYLRPYYFHSFAVVAAFLIAALFQTAGSTAASLEAYGTYVELGEGIQIVYQIPMNITSVVGVLLVAHGCSHSATDWWKMSDKCQKCIGLPVERSIVKMAVQSGMAVIALSSNNRGNKCWIYEHDRMRAIKAIRYMYDKISTLTEENRVPLYLLGVSSGGSFVGTFAQDAKFTGLLISAICVQVMSVKIHRLEDSMVPTIFVHMPSDTRTAKMVSKVVAQMNEKTPNSAMEMRCERKQITSTYFFDHGVALSAEDSATLVQALNAAGYLSITNTLIDDPRKSLWREV